MKLPGGLDINAVRYTDEVRDVVKDLLPHARLVLKLPAETEAGSRFNNDEMTLWRVESMFSEDEFLSEPLKVIEAALIDAAKSDWWYSNEKDYGQEHETHDDAEDAC